MIIEVLTREQFEQSLLNHYRLVVYFTAKWCGPCKQYGKIFEHVANRDKFQMIGFLKIDVDQIPALLPGLRVSSVPTTIIFKKGQEVGREVGAVLDTHLEQYITDTLLEK